MMQTALLLIGLTIIGLYVYLEMKGIVEKMARIKAAVDELADDAAEDRAALVAINETLDAVAQTNLTVTETLGLVLEEVTKLTTFFEGVVESINDDDQTLEETSVKAESALASAKAIEDKVREIKEAFASGAANPDPTPDPVPDPPVVDPTL